ncbi:class I SAM-dependent methyltransferase [Embleya sp. MST-111070]|uniref:class I SAM-dependent methyltransferase n=1 Tax=Embleya sp. MST-111070 TaxID=3398231 RepID=UPI003F739801
MTTFSGTAAHYRAHRPGIPDRAAELLTAAAAELPAPRTLLDLGTGTGQVPAALHESFARIDLVEADADMLAEAEADLRPRLRPGTALHGHHTRAEDFTAPNASWRADLVTAARAFHWMDQDLVLGVLDGCTSPRATVAIMGDGSLWTARTAWTDALRALIQEYLGEQRRAGTGATYAAPGRPYAEVLRESAFSAVEEHHIPIVRTWTPDHVVGYLYSTSFANRALFADRAADFERDAHTLLADHAARGEGLTEHASFQLLLARRPH